MLEPGDGEYDGDLVLTNNVMEESPVVVRDRLEPWSPHTEHQEIHSCVQALEKGVELDDSFCAGHSTRFAFVQPSSVIDVKGGASDVRPVTPRLKCAARCTAGCVGDWAAVEKVDDRTFPSSCFSEEDDVGDRSMHMFPGVSLV